jgi:hypothetical protein
VVEDEEIGKAAVLFHGIRAVAAALSVDSGKSGGTSGSDAALPRGVSGAAGGTALHG